MKDAFVFVVSEGEEPGITDLQCHVGGGYSLFRVPTWNMQQVAFAMMRCAVEILENYPIEKRGYLPLRCPVCDHAPVLTYASVHSTKTDKWRKAYTMRCGCRPDRHGDPFLKDTVLETVVAWNDYADAKCKEIADANISAE